MSGIHTCERFAILANEGGINLDTFKTRQELAEHAIRLMWRDMPGLGDRIIWLQGIVDGMKDELAEELAEARRLDDGVQP